jgi:hypothetical protein
MPSGAVMAGEVGAVAAEVGELLAVLIVKIASATLAEMHSLVAEAKEAARLILRCAWASDPGDNLPPKEVEMLRAELLRLSDSLEAQIAEMDIRLLFAGGAASPTRH